MLTSELKETKKFPSPGYLLLHPPLPVEDVGGRQGEDARHDPQLSYCGGGHQKRLQGGLSLTESEKKMKLFFVISIGIVFIVIVFLPD